MISTISAGAGLRASLLAFVCLLPFDGARAQDHVLVYGNSIIFSPTVPYFRDLVAQTGAPAPHVVESIGPDRWTSDHVNQIGLITTSLPAGQNWRAMIVQGGTIENSPTLGNPTAFQANMLTLANAFFAHSPNGCFVGHETGADHPNSGNYPTLAPDPATWLAWSHNAYATAAQAITAAHPGNPPARLALQGTCVASTAGYPLFLYSNLHELSVQGKVLTAMLWYVAIYGRDMRSVAVDFTTPTPLVTRLLADGINQAAWLRLVGFADYVQPPAAHPFPGSSGDFQLRTSINSTTANLIPMKTAVANNTLRLQMVSPLGATQNAPAAIFSTFAPTGVFPAVSNPPGFWLQGNPTRLAQVTNLGIATFNITIPAGMAGYTMWIQAVSQGPAGGPLTYSDAHWIEIH